MSTKSLLAHALVIASAAHELQFDKAGDAYMLHQIRMMMKAHSDDQRIVALLHDIVEDTDWTLDALRAEGFPEAIIAGVDGMTKRDGESYEEFIERAAKDPIALRVKLLDLEDNMTMTRLSSVHEKDLERLRKYHNAYRRLTTLAK
ncbi:MAG TPA: hypothetical protein VGK19_16050 [Capsulimonadaceae bacterium]|jgi:(p)ppGpp synthase/HD superfamily hydrolase